MRRPSRGAGGGGVDYDDATGCLEREGVDKFLASFREMMGDIEEKRAALAASRPVRTAAGRGPDRLLMPRRILIAKPGLDGHDRGAR